MDSIRVVLSHSDRFFASVQKYLSFISNVCKTSVGFFFCHKVPWFLLFPFLPYFRISTSVVDGENLYELLIFIGGEMNHEREFFYDHAAHLSVTYGMARRLALQGIDLDYYFFLET
jgi:hypothetical protein